MLLIASEASLLHELAGAFLWYIYTVFPRVVPAGTINLSLWNHAATI